MEPSERAGGGGGRAGGRWHTANVLHGRSCRQLGAAKGFHAFSSAVVAALRATAYRGMNPIDRGQKCMSRYNALARGYSAFGMHNTSAMLGRKGEQEAEDGRERGQGGTG